MEEQDFPDYLTLPTSLYNRIEKNVADLFVQLNINRYPVDPIAIAMQLGYELMPFSKMNKEAKKMLVSKNVDGISYFDPKRKKYIIYFRPDGTKKRLRFTIGHEIAHIRMEHRGESELARRIADYYSAYLLAPSPWIGYAGCEDFADVAAAFDISDICAMRCFERYARWKKISFKKAYEKTLLDLISQRGVGAN